MGVHFPAVKAKELIRVLHGLGFRLARQSRSSHAVFYRENDRRRTVVPIHPGAIIKRKTLRSILRDAGLSVEELRRLL